MAHDPYLAYRKIVEDTLQGVYLEMQDGFHFQNVTLAIAARIALAEQDMLKQQEVKERYITLLALVHRLDVDNMFFGVGWGDGYCRSCGLPLMWHQESETVRGHYEDQHKADCVVLALRAFMREGRDGAPE